MSRTSDVDLDAERDVDRVPEDDLEAGDVVRLVGVLDDELGVVVSGPPGARVQLPETGMTVRAESGPVAEVLDHVDGILGVDSRGKYHLYRRAAREVIVQNADGDVELRKNLSPGHINQWFRHVEKLRGWQTHSTITDSRGWFS